MRVRRVRSILMALLISAMLLVPLASAAVYTRDIPNFPTTRQEQTNWCQIASAWLITKYYYPTTTRTQTNIANKMGVYSNTGPRWYNEIQYYLDPWSMGGLGKPNSVTNYWAGQPPLSYSMVKTEIDARRPIKVGHNGHARVLIGYWMDGTRYIYEFSDPGYAISGLPPIYWEYSPNQGALTGYQNYILAK